MRYSDLTDMARVPVTGDNQDQVLLRSRRRCCVCYGLHGDLSVKQGQIAHLDQDNANSDPDNLAFLCLLHHDQYDGKTSQSKALRESEVKHHRTELYAKIAAGLPIEPTPQQDNLPKSSLPLEQKTPPPKPRIEWGWSFPAVTYDATHGVWTEYSDIHAPIYKACVISVANHLHDSSGKGTKATQLRAQIFWTYSHDVQGPRFSPAPWLGEELGQIELPVGITKKVLVAVRSSTGEYWDGYSNSRLDATQRIQISSDMVPYAGTMIIKLIDSSDELLAETKWSWEEDVNTHWPLFKPLFVSASA